MAAVRDFLLDDDGDFAVVNGDFATVADLAAVVQGVEMRILFFLGEYFLDESIGVDWFGKVLKKNPNPLEVREELRRAIASTPDVLEVTSLALTIDPETRQGTIGYTVRTIYNRSISGSIVAPS
jgi:hypothetical protein